MELTDPKKEAKLQSTTLEPCLTEKSLILQSLEENHLSSLWVWAKSSKDGMKESPEWVLEKKLSSLVLPIMPMANKLLAEIWSQPTPLWNSKLNYSLSNEIYDRSIPFNFIYVKIVVFISKIMIY